MAFLKNSNMAQAFLRIKNKYWGEKWIIITYGTGIKQLIK